MGNSFYNNKKMETIFKEGKKYRKKAIMDIGGIKTTIKYNSIATLNYDNKIIIDDKYINFPANINFSPNTDDIDIKIIKHIKIKKKIKKYQPSSPISEFSLQNNDKIDIDKEINITTNELNKLKINNDIGKLFIPHLTEQDMKEINEELKNDYVNHEEQENLDDDEMNELQLESMDYKVPPISDAEMEEYRSLLEND